MIIVKFIGGLGNQMFQYAYARMLQQVYNEEIYFDITSYEKYKIRKFSLNNLNIDDNIKYISDLNISNYTYIKIKITQKLYRVYQKIVKLIKGNEEVGFKSFKVLARNGYYYNHDVYYYPIIKTNKKIKVIYGYFQSEKYFEKIKECIKEELLVKVQCEKSENIILESILKSCSVGVSIRWGNDYKNSGLNVCNKEYFYKAMDKVNEKVKNPTFFIFSDEIDAVKEEFKFKYNVKYIENMNDYQSLRLLYSCKHFIISNSSFSWFGAYLSKNKSKIIISPNKWYLGHDKKADILMDSMLLIET